jgi:hypothetical protein
MLLILFLIMLVASIPVVYLLMNKFMKDKEDTDADAENVDIAVEIETLLTNGRHVKFMNPKGCINLMWIKVYGVDTLDGEERLISEGKPATASTVLSKNEKEFGAQNISIYGAPEMKWDGMYHSYCDGKEQWVNIDLEKDYKITRIEIKNREGKYSPRIKEGVISILDKDNIETWSQVVSENKTDYTYVI